LVKNIAFTFKKTCLYIKENPCDVTVRYPSVSLNTSLSRNEKVEQHITKNIHKSNTLRFWIEGNIILLYVGFSSHSCLIFSVVFLP